MRKLGIDYGDARIGLALTDPMCIICSPYAVYTRKNLDADIKHLSNLICEQSVNTVIFGLPVNMDGSEGVRACGVRDFAARLSESIDTEIVFVDERLTTVASEKFLISNNVKREKRKEVIDKIAAQMILQTYMDNPKGIIK